MDTIPAKDSYEAALQVAQRKFGEDWQRLARIVWDEIDGWHVRHGGPLDVSGHERHEGDNHA